MEDKFKNLEQKIGYNLKNQVFLKQALTHSSYASENQVENNERLEFLGDAVLELVIRDYLFYAYPHLKEGELSKLKACLVEETTLAKVARSLCLGNFLKLGKGERQTGGNKKVSILADALEALIGAIYLDSDFLTVCEVIRNWFEPWLKKLSPDKVEDFKTRLQMLLQKQCHRLPAYRVLNTMGPDHAKQFIIGVFINGKLLGKGVGKSRKRAEQEAAKQALNELKLRNI
ncbi:MAG: ribonuclease III [Candidatus Desulfofervidus auxilii]|nr:ribonuclease III [Candidatus Desulfofervidus auxilii]